MNISEKSLKSHETWSGKIEVISRAKITGKDDLSIAYTPGVAAPCLEIAKEPELSYKYTRRGNLVAVITDGTAVLGLGDIGGLAGMPVMEGKCCLFKEFAGIDAFPICIKSKNTDEIVRTIELISDSFGGINLEDISSPRCFEVERLLKERLNIPVFHDDQHGTAVVVAAALINSMKLTEKKIENIRIVINGAGAAGTAIAKLLLSLGAGKGTGDLILCDKSGILSDGEDYVNESHREMAGITNKQKIKGKLALAAKGADVIIGVSKSKAFSPDIIKNMADKPIVFAMANPEPEIFPDEAKSSGAFIVGTGRSDFPNQINNLLVFPGVFKGALAVRAREITEDMKLAAARAIADYISPDKLSVDYIIPSPLDKAVVQSVSDAVATEGIKQIAKEETSRMLKELTQKAEKLNNKV